MERLILLICTILSLVLFFISPVTYDALFCSLCAIIALVVIFIIVKNDIKYVDLVNFNLIFTFSFFVCSFVFAVFLIEGKSIIGELLKYEIETLNTVNKCSAICSLAISCYGFGYLIIRNKKIQNIQMSLPKAAIVYRNSRLITLLLSVYVVADMVLFFQNNQDSINKSVSYLEMIFYIMIPTLFITAALYYNNYSPHQRIRKIITDNKVVCACIALIIIIDIITGDRGPVFQLFIMLFCVYEYFVKKIRLKYLVLTGVVGVLLMFSLRVTRNLGDASLRTGDLSSFIEKTSSEIIDTASPWDLLSDLIGVSFELNEGMYIVEKKGHFNTGPNVVRYVTSPLPFVSTFVITNFYHLEVEDISPDYYIGSYTSTNSGNHIVIDAYMPFGWIGVMIAFIILGIFVGIITNGFSNNLFCTFFYVYLMGLAIYYPRSHMVGTFKFILVAYFLYYALSRLRIAKT